MIHLSIHSSLNHSSVHLSIHPPIHPFINPMVHSFIYPFLSSLKPLDIQFMKELHHLVNIIPVIAKADTLTPSEIKKLKIRVLPNILFVMCFYLATLQSNYSFVHSFILLSPIHSSFFVSSIHPFIHPSLCPFIYHSFIHSSIHLFIHPSTYLSIYSFIDQSIFPFIFQLCIHIHIY